jgi:hypothetical protein
MATKSLTSGPPVPSESITVISMAYTMVLSELRLAVDCEEANELATLVLKIAGEETKLDAATLVSKAKMAWEERSSGKD